MAAAGVLGVVFVAHIAVGLLLLGMFVKVSCLDVDEVVWRVGLLFA